MKIIKIGFSRPRSFFKPFSWLIRLFEWSRFSHVYISSYSEKYKTELIYQASGVQLNFMSKKHFDSASIIVEEFEFEVSGEDFDSYMNFAVKESGAPYSIKKVFEIGISKVISRPIDLVNDENIWVCSKLAGKVLKRFFNNEINEMEVLYSGPKDIYKICKKIKANHGTVSTH